MAHSKHSGGGSPTLDTVIGIAVKDDRTNAGMTLNELSQKSGVSTAMISKIERGQVSGSIGSLNTLAEAMGVPIINFFAETIEHREVCFVRAGEGIAVERSGIEFEIFLITLEKTTAGERLFHHNGVEFIRMEKGSMTYRYGDRTFLLEPGDSLTFETEAPHGPVSLQTDSVEFLTVVAKPKK